MLSSFQEKNGWNNNESMDTKMEAIENIKTTNNGYELSCELKNMPVSFVNAIRRILIHGIPTVVARDIQILENTTQMPHEMLKHRVEMLPINVKPDDATTIRDAKIGLRILLDKEAKEAINITTDDFTIESGRENIIMKDRDMNTPLLFMRMRPSESLHIKARLAVETENVSQVCTATTQWHPDPERIKLARKEYVDAGNDVRLFDNFLYQREYSRNESGRPNWFDLHIESVGVLKSVDLLKMAIQILRRRVDEYLKDALENIARHGDDTYTVPLEIGGHTLGYLFQEVMYSDQNVNFVSYDRTHPLTNTLILQFHTKKSPESTLKTARDIIEEYCSVIEKGL
jgi:DNA-directed RNA polymerase subunit L